MGPTVAREQGIILEVVGEVELDSSDILTLQVKLDCQAIPIEQVELNCGDILSSLVF